MEPIHRSFRFASGFRKRSAGSYRGTYALHYSFRMRVRLKSPRIFDPSRNVSFLYFQELSQKHGLVVTETRRYSDYLPTHIHLMDRIVADTYQKTRGAFIFYFCSSSGLNSSVRHFAILYDFDVIMIKMSALQNAYFARSL